MRPLALLVLFASAPALAQDFPPLTGRVVDAANILTPEAEAYLTSLSESHEAALGDQVVFATVPSLQGYDIRQFGVGLAREWQIGEADEDNGVVLLVAPNERQVAIETGYGTEGELTDAIARVIIEGAILPRFREGDYSDGVVRGAQDIVAVLGGDKDAVVRNARERLEEDDAAGSFVSTIFVAVVLWLFLSGMFGGRGRRRGRRGRRRGGPIFVPGGFGGGRGGFGGGGGFSGGGGSFGGGGASGSW